jgi:hypothetical protein
MKHARHGCEIADVAVDNAEERNDGGLVRRDAVEVAHLKSRVQKIGNY